jgi:hypothetical protein
MEEFVEQQVQQIAEELNLKAHYAINVIFVSTIKSTWQIYYRCKDNKILVNKLLHSSSRINRKNSGKKKLEHNYHNQNINTGCELKDVMEYIANHDRFRKRGNYNGK